MCARLRNAILSVYIYTENQMKCSQTDARFFSTVAKQLQIGNSLDSFRKHWIPVYDLFYPLHPAVINSF